MSISEEPSLFDPPAPDPPAQNHSATSRAAAKQARLAAPRRRERLLGYLRRRGNAGATDAEMQEALGISGDSQRPTRVDLVKRGVVMDSGRTRQTPSGRAATVWIVAPEGGGA